MTPEQFTEILGLTESEGRVEAWGDDTKGTKPPLAMGRFQIHPAWLWDHTRSEDAKPAVLESWDTWIARLITSFARQNAMWRPEVLAMWFHLGHRTFHGNPDWDDAYEFRFNTHASANLS